MLSVFVSVYYATWAHVSDVRHKSLPSVCVSVCVTVLSLLVNGSVKCIPPFVFRQRLGKHFPAATNTHNNIRIVGRVIFYAVRVLPKREYVGLSVCLSLLGNSSVKTFPLQRIIIGGVFFYEVRVVLKKSRLLVFPGTCFVWGPNH
jgi:hypothetical protein